MKKILIFTLQVDGKPLGLAMNKSLLPIRPAKVITASKEDSPVRKKVMALVSTMLSPIPRKRPSIDQVLQELTDIAGEFHSN